MKRASLHSVKPRHWQTVVTRGSLRRYLRRNRLHLWSLRSRHHRQRSAAPSTYKKMKDLVGTAQEHRYSTFQIPITTMALIRAYRVSRNRQRSVCLASGSLDMVPLFPHRHTGATSMEGINVATTSWAIQTVNTGRRPVTPVVPSPSPSGSGVSVPGQIIRRYSPASTEYALLASRISMLLTLVFRMPSLLHEANSVPLFPSARPRAFRYIPH